MHQGTYIIRYISQSRWEAHHQYKVRDKRDDARDRDREVLPEAGVRYALQSRQVYGREELY